LQKTKGGISIYIKNLVSSENSHCKEVYRTWLHVKNLTPKRPTRFGDKDSDKVSRTKKLE